MMLILRKKKKLEIEKFLCLIFFVWFSLKNLICLFPVPIFQIGTGNKGKDFLISICFIFAKNEEPFFYRIMDLVKYLAVSMILFLLGIWGIFLNRKNIIVMLMSIELMLLAVNLNFLLFSVYLDDLIGQLFALLILTVAAAESAIGLALLVVYYRVRGTIAVEFINLLKG